MDNLNYPGTIGGRLPPGKSVTDLTTERMFQLGSRHVFGERAYRYAHVKKGENEVRRGAVMVSWNSAEIEHGDKLGAVTQGAERITWTIVGTEILQDQFAGGNLLMEGGECIPIKSNAPGKRGVAITVMLNEPIVQASAASGRYGIMTEGLYDHVIERSEGNTGPGLIVGVPNVDLIGDGYCWLQTWGPCAVIGTQPVLNDRNQATGIMPGFDSDSQDQLIVTDGTEAREERIIGHGIPYNIENWDNAAYRMLFLNICP